MMGSPVRRFTSAAHPPSQCAIVGRSAIDSTAKHESKRRKWSRMAIAKLDYRKLVFIGIGCFLGGYVAFFLSARFGFWVSIFITSIVIPLYFASKLRPNFQGLQGFALLAVVFVVGCVISSITTREVYALEWDTSIVNLRYQADFGFNYDESAVAFGSCGSNEAIVAGWRRYSTTASDPVKGEPVPEGSDLSIWRGEADAGAESLGREPHIPRIFGTPTIGTAEPLHRLYGGGVLCWSRERPIVWGNGRDPQDKFKTAVWYPVGNSWTLVGSDADLVLSSAVQSRSSHGVVGFYWDESAEEYKCSAFDKLEPQTLANPAELTTVETDRRIFLYDVKEDGDELVLLLGLWPEVSGGSSPNATTKVLGISRIEFGCPTGEFEIEPVRYKDGVGVPASEVSGTSLILGPEGQTGIVAPDSNQVLQIRHAREIDELPIPDPPDLDFRVRGTSDTVSGGTWLLGSVQTNVQSDKTTGASRTKRGAARKVVWVSEGRCLPFGEVCLSSKGS